LRADAARNRQRVLEVAKAVFADEGLEVPIDDIARRAGLGVGTLYRHFPTKEALFEAILVSRMESVVADARKAAQADDAGAAFFGFLERLGRESLAKKDLVEALRHSRGGLQSTAKAAKKELAAAVEALLVRAQEKGAVRGDVAVEDVLVLVGGAFVAIERHGVDARARARLLTILCDGLRPPQPPSRASR
jgi:AcrR family transcriptional regulator